MEPQDMENTGNGCSSVERRIDWLTNQDKARGGLVAEHISQCQSWGAAQK